MKMAMLGAFTLILAATVLDAAPQEQRTFATPQEAAQSLVEAAGQNDTAALLQLFGPQGRDIVQSGDPAEDKNSRAEFARRAHEKLQIELEALNPDRATIVTRESELAAADPAGAEEWAVALRHGRRSRGDSRSPHRAS